MERATPLTGAGIVLAVLGLVGLASAVPEPDGPARQGRDPGEPPAEPSGPPAPAPPPSPGAAALLEGEPLDVNRASARDLQLLPRIGPALAGRILKERRAGGPFGSLEDLTRVRGIGPKTVEGLRGLARAGPSSDISLSDQTLTNQK